MKYSLSNKEFKKRNNIFGERKQEYIHTEDHNQRLDCIKQLGQDLEDSNLQNDFVKDRKSKSIYEYIDFTTVKHEDPKLRIKDGFSKNSEAKAGRHGLSPNTKPSVPIIRTAPPISTISSKQNLVPKRKLTIESNVIQFYHNSSQNQEIFAQMKHLVMKLYMIITKNNQKIELLEKGLYLLVNRNKKMLEELNYCMSNAFKIDSKVDLFLNTMRNVYQNLRISRLKQENLELYLKQATPDDTSKQKSESKHSRINNPSPSLHSIKNPNPSIHHQSFKQTEELISLLEYESDSSMVQQYPRQQREQSTNHNIKTKTYEQSNESIQISRISGHLKQKNNSISQDTFRMEQSKFEKLSPFQANKLISNSASTFLHEMPDYDTQMKVYENKHPQKSIWSYSFEVNQIDKVRNWCLQRGESGMPCWLDDMGCLRRPNMTYVFWSTGQVMRINEKVFNKLILQGIFVNCRPK